MADPLLIFGANGQVGQALTHLCPDYGFDPIALTSTQGDITHLERLHQLKDQYPTAPVVNAAAYTGVDKAEEDQISAYMVNAMGPGYLAALFGQDRPLVHFSTDYVFGGGGSTPFGEDDPVSPLGVYGMSKHMGEKAVLSCPHGTVIRTAWVYSDQGHNFLKTMLRVGKDRKHLKVVDDQIGTPTHASDIAQGALSLLKAQLAGKATASPGLYHYTAKGQTSWHGFAAEIFQVLKHQTSIEVKLEAISTAEYPTPATRPQFSVLDCRKIDQIEGLIRPDWQAPIEATVASVLKGEAS